MSNVWSNIAFCIYIFKKSPIFMRFCKCYSVITQLVPIWQIDILNKIWIILIFRLCAPLWNCPRNSPWAKLLFNTQHWGIVENLAMTQLPGWQPAAKWLKFTKLIENILQIYEHIPKKIIIPDYKGFLDKSFRIRQQKHFPW